jgi:hypothetical protein
MEINFKLLARFSWFRIGPISGFLNLSNESSVSKEQEFNKPVSMSVSLQKRQLI